MTMRKAVERAEKQMAQTRQRVMAALAQDTTNDLAAMRYLQGTIAGLGEAIEMLADMRKHYDEEADDADRDPD
jgi:hypothetical protein